MVRDKIDFGKMKVGELFVRQLIPNVLGMVFTALFIITDGIFVGRGIGSNALAAVNIVAPVSLFMTGVGLMFGMGGAIMASINLARNKSNVANINISQAVCMSSFLMILFSLIVCTFPEKASLLLGAPAGILPEATGYMFFYSLFAVFQSLLCVLPFFVRLNNPNYSMICLVTGTLLNIVLDYIFIFIFGWGLMGAALATGTGQIVAVVMLVVYLLRPTANITLVKLKMSLKSIRLSLRNIGYMMRLGCPAFFSEITISLMMLAGNFVFAKHLGVSGVAAYSIICYLFPVIFMLYNALVQSAQPIISYNYGRGVHQRSQRAMRMALASAVLVGIFFLFVSQVAGKSVVSLFITDTGNPAWEMAVYGLPLFAIDFIFFGINIVMAGYYMCVENIKRAITFTLVRGILPVICFFVLPLWWGVNGIWLAVPVAEIVTTFLIFITIIKERYKWKNLSGNSIPASLSQKQI
ncbi:MAG: MATE family efflux transporter [Tannerellaceae bacterium]|nr:MATE family efflux transporter [Tannerellaceae bacterium]